MKPDIEALSRVVALLRAPLPSGIDRFDLCVWKSAGFECGTTACACGLAAGDSWFKDRGFHMKGSALAYDHLFNWDAVYSFFNLSLDDASYLFSRHKYEHGHRSASDVASRIEQFIKDHS